MPISVIVPVLNGQRTIKSCIDSLLSQTYSQKKEIIVVDNGSTDNTLEILKGYGDSIRVLHESKIGSYNARNMGVMHSRGNILLFIDSDCIASSKWIENMASGFNERIKIVGGSIRSTSRASYIQRYCDRFCHIQERFVQTHMFATSNMGVQKDVLVQAGLFNADLKSGGDFEVCTRIVNDSSEISFVADATVYHHYPDSIIALMSKNYHYGLWNSIIHQQRLNKKGNKAKQKKYRQTFRSKDISLSRVFLKHGMIFGLFRLAHDFSFNLGLLVGGLKR